MADVVVLYKTPKDPASFEVTAADVPNFASGGADILIFDARDV